MTMSPDKLRLMQETETKILFMFADFCEAHNLTYFLEAGTLLGAVRHGGFIPWDDDVDVVMPYPDYQRFLELAPTCLPDSYLLQNYLNEDHFYRNYSKIMSKELIVMPEGYEKWDVAHYAWIDIFPMALVESDRSFRFKTFVYKFASCLQKNNYVLGREVKHQTPPVEFLYNRAIQFLNLFSVQRRKKWHNSLLRYVFGGSGPIAGVGALRFYKAKASYYLDGQPTYLSFEGKSLRVPSDYHALLVAGYGDYMQLPPEDQRGSHSLLYVCTPDEMK